MDALTIDVNSLTIAEVEAVEEIIGGPIDTLGKPGALKGKLLRAIAFVAGRRNDPGFTIEDAGHVRISAIGQGAPDPFVPAASSPAPDSAATSPA
ncbi:hypothetical protein JOD54_000831 [Actinokineospora baliensis]|uniref:hypothetical protein n=1 Tax=Actinokineospora baliensis TaxID=547056 RepID=UPI00195BA75E|nr:hypothetical protein [Actinokineospora baliensis]MBM7770627.1 hypothetical protein [Actinokineospora baliensis]